jgi:hypothetical protein
VSLQEARRIYQSVVDEARRRGALVNEQKHELPTAAIMGPVYRGEVKVTRPAPEEFCVIWYPPETHVGQRLDVIDASDEHLTVYITHSDAGGVVSRIFGEAA